MAPFPNCYAKPLGFSLLVVSKIQESFLRMILALLLGIPSCVRCMLLSLYLSPPHLSKLGVFLSKHSSSHPSLSILKTFR